MGQAGKRTKGEVVSVCPLAQRAATLPQGHPPIPPHEA